MTQLSLVVGTAEFSQDEAMVHRYRLTREWDADRAVVNFVGLNPSTADALVDDPTIRRCIGFARRWGFGKLVMTNLFAYRATDPAELCLAEIDVIGPENDDWLERSASEASLVVAAWGAVGGLLRSSVPFAHRRSVRVGSLLVGVKPLHALGFTKAGYPRHPLYMRGDSRPLPWMEA